MDRQQARNMCMEMQEQTEKPRFLIHDLDTKFTQQFDGIFRAEQIRTIKLPFQSPNLNAHCERVIKTIKEECLDHFMVFGEEHLDHIVRVFVDHYHRLRPHQGIGNVPPLGEPPPDVIERVDPDRIVCHERLGGLLKHFQRVAA